MALDLADYEIKAQEAIKAFWGNRALAKKKQEAAGKIDQGERAGVTGGKNLDGFISLILELVQKNGLGHADIHRRKALVTLPGFFRPTKQWDLVVIHQGRLVAAIELKSHVGPSFSNNFNNRTEEAIGTAQDIWTAYRENAFGEQPRPFVGWLIVVEDAMGSQKPVRDQSTHFPVFREFQGASYLKRYDILCQRLVKEQLYTSASVIGTPRTAAETGAYTELSTMTGLREFVTSFAAHIAAEAARQE
ncbi:PaeR7I family type II restriction endonuclease [Massilia psychrophila]|uniref:Type-2 restriction enzyme n=1 Tax=Massilia psychrophila TaxID=1603353 RepID=A0A2G8SZJ3_9BURK|nr:PaeR7I family type II restriction endonuclease [Massilia psychrophila]PIL39210.1 restriction endonuclease [Massilia psychrophila]GGE82004.1 type-2 restriction enzyme [Massilia psychrophila]